MIKKLVQLTSGSVLLLLTAICLADDTDIYLNGGAGLPVGSEPMVIFSLDYRPNLGSTACSGSECDTLIAEGEYVVMQSQGTSRTKAGGTYNNTYCHVFRVVNGKVQELVEYLDPAVITAAFGTQDSAKARIDS